MSTRRLGINPTLNKGWSSTMGIAELLVQFTYWWIYRHVTKCDSPCIDVFKPGTQTWRQGAFDRWQRQRLLAVEYSATTSSITRSDITWNVPMRSPDVTTTGPPIAVQLRHVSVLSTGELAATYAGETVTSSLLMAFLLSGWMLHVSNALIVRAGVNVFRNTSRNIAGIFLF